MDTALKRRASLTLPPMPEFSGTLSTDRELASEYFDAIRKPGFKLRLAGSRKMRVTLIERARDITKP